MPRIEELSHKGRSYRGGSLNLSANLPRVAKDPTETAREIEQGPRAIFWERESRGVTYWEFLLGRGYREE